MKLQSTDVNKKILSIAGVQSIVTPDITYQLQNYEYPESR